LTANGFTETPYDFIADQLRGFGNISMDIRRHRSEIKEACEALLPLMFNMGLPETPHPEGNVFIPLHMPTFMREKDFVDIYLPTFKTLLEQYAALGVRCCLFCEDDWTRYADILMELPAGTQLLFEYGDAKVLKEKLGKKFILQGLYPVGLLKMGTKQQVIDKAKELLDTMMLGGGYSFAFDKEPMTLSEINLENWIALSEFVSEYGVYKNAGEAYGTPLNSESFVFSEEKIKPIKSKYWFDWDNFKKENPLVPDFAKKRFMKHNKSVFSFYMNLLV
ncbi:MAG: uroporphyrinogen decarboxylase family protein, partial [Eubacterium sp.]